MVVLDAAFHILQLVQHGEHVDKLAEGEQVRLGHKVLPALCVTQAADLPTKAVDGSALKDSDILHLYITFKSLKCILNVHHLPGST